MAVKFPLGIDRFDKLRTGGYYYVDKTELIHELLKTEFEVNLITRPRRFGKTLTMSMLESFFDINKDSRSIFTGLSISQDAILCKRWMNQWPVIFLTLKTIEGNTFDNAYGMLKVLVANLCKKYAFLEKSEAVDNADKLLFRKIKFQEAEMENLKDSLQLLTRMMHAHFGKQVIVLADEYDVPLAKAYDNGYYKDMLDVVRSMLGNALKTNPHLKFSVITGCLRISHESIFTGINNLVPFTISDEMFDEYFGFTETNIRKLLFDAGVLDHLDEMKEWYDGYRFGSTEVYCPWDVLNHAQKIQINPNTKPETYWANTSSNTILRKFLQKATRSVKAEIEQLIAGGEVIKKVDEQLTYSDIDSSIDNLWSILYSSGYLTQRGMTKEGTLRLVIPNREIREIFKNQIMDWMKNDLIAAERTHFEAMSRAFQQGDAEGAEKQFNFFLKKMISLRDTYVRKQYKENFYHGMLLGMLAANESWGVRSNKETGDGYSDICVEIENEDTAFIIELKYAEDGNLALACEDAMKQIERKQYTQSLNDYGYETIYVYGIACYLKRCKIECRSGKE